MHLFLKSLGQRTPEVIVESRASFHAALGLVGREEYESSDHSRGKEVATTEDSTLAQEQGGVVHEEDLQVGATTKVLESNPVDELLRDFSKRFLLHQLTADELSRLGEQNFSRQVTKYIV